MATIERIEDLICWQKSRVLIKKIYDVSARSFFSKDYGLKDQMRRASVSVMLNIAEGFGRRSNKEFKHFLFMSHGSVSELQSGLYVAVDLNYISKEMFELLYSDCDEVSRIISGLIKSLK